MDLGTGAALSNHPCFSERDLVVERTRPAPLCPRFKVATLPPGTSRALALMASGWVHTELGGPEARLSIDESVPNLVNVLLKKTRDAGLEYLDYLGRTVPW